jgi:hypothetical protein
LLKNLVLKGWWQFTSNRKSRQAFQAIFVNFPDLVGQLPDELAHMPMCHHIPGFDAIMMATNSITPCNKNK